MKLLGHFLTVASICFVSNISEAANRYVRPGATGNNTGTDWGNAYTNLPTTLVRGDTYYLADGTYGSYVFDDPSSGSILITLKKATQSDHGTDTGWSSTYGVGQATFTSWKIPGDYYVFDGQRRNTNWKLGGIDQYGIRVHNPSGIPARLDNSASDFGNDLSFQYIDFEGPGRDYLGDSAGGIDVIYSNAWTGGGVGPRNITFSKCAFHDSDRTIFLTRQWNNLLVEYSYIARNGSSPAIHGEILSDDGSDNVTFRYNVIEDPEGTAVFAILNGSGAKSAANTATNWQIYGNVVLHTPGYGREGITGLVFSANDAGNKNWSDNWRIYNNTIYQIRGLWSGVVIQAGSGNVVQNNIWYGSVRTNNTGASFDYNWYYNTVADGDTGPNKIVCVSNCAVFVDSANRDFRLAQPVGAGISLPSPFNMDMDSVLRGSDGVWDRGAYEFGGVGGVLPAPGNLRIVP